VRILVTGGAGFVGSNVVVGLAQRHPEWELLALDNLKRRGSELNLARLAVAGARFVHGDVRERADLDACGAVDVIVECSAEPSVLAGLDGDLDYLVRTNLFGAFNCLELARRDSAQFIFLSTSRVYPVCGLAALDLVEVETRFELAPNQFVAGASQRGIAESFDLTGARSFYGSSKLAVELLAQEYTAAFDLRVVVNRCGVIAGPWQMGKVDQGVFTYWLLAHCFGQPLEYIGFGGSGKQVRDLLHVDDLVDLLDDQIARPEEWSGATVNVGGGLGCSLSLAETTILCRDLTGNDVEIRSVLADRPGDVPLYISDCTRCYELTSWRPRRDAPTILRDTLDWIRGHEDDVRRTLGFG
jgi:CDP-paratose 2-epimerase